MPACVYLGIADGMYRLYLGIFDSMFIGGVPVLKMTASEARPYLRSGHAVGDAEVVLAMCRAPLESSCRRRC